MLFRSVGLILLGLADQVEQAARIFLVGNVIVDQADQDALALGSLGEAVLQVFLGEGLVALLVGDVSQLGESLAVLAIVAVGDALLEELLRAVPVLGLPGGEAGVVDGVVVGLAERSGAVAEALAAFSKKEEASASLPSV